MNIKSTLKNKILPIAANLLAEKNHQNILLNNAISRSACGANRVLDKKRTQTWEFSGFSQNGEDGIIEVMLSGLKDSNRYFIEIGSGDGLENNTSYLAHIKKFCGLQIEGDRNKHERALNIKPWLVDSINIFVNNDTMDEIFARALFKDPDVFSIDIDGVDYYIAKLLLEKGFLPKVFIVEYNSAYGKEVALTIPYNATFNMFETQHPYLYYGVSLNGWKILLAKYGYDFVTVESNGVNAFFVRKENFVSGFFENVLGLEFRENLHQLRLFKTEFKGQFALMDKLPFETISMDR